MPWEEKDRHGSEKPFRYVFHIQKSTAGYTEYNQGQTCLLILEGKRQSVDGDLEDHHLWLSVGAFQPGDDDGTSFLHESGDESERFHPSSKVQQFIESAIDAGVPLEERGINSLDATMYAGLSVVIEEVKKNAVIDGETRNWRVPTVIRYIGEFTGEPEFSDVDINEEVGAF